MSVRFHRRSLRLREYGYSLPGAYFVTVCARDRACLFGNVADGQMRLNHMGMLVAAAWNSLHDDDRGIVLDAFIVMPNHVHGIIVITDGGIRDVVGNNVGAIRGGANHVGAIHESPLQGLTQRESPLHQPQTQISPGHTVE